MINSNFGIVLICAVGMVVLIAALGFIMFMRYMHYRETLALAEKGLARPEKPADGKATLRWGIIITALGLALGIGLYPLGLGFGNVYPLGLGPWMLFSLVPLFFGLALILVYVVTKKE